MSWSSLITIDFRHSSTISECNKQKVQTLYWQTHQQQIGVCTNKKIFSSSDFQQSKVTKFSWFCCSTDFGLYIPENIEVGYYTISISIEACENGCNGKTCNMLYTNGVLQGYCDCGYFLGGADCTENVKPHKRIVLEVSLLVSTNIAIVPAIILAIKRRCMLEGLVFFMTGVCSSLTTTFIDAAHWISPTSCFWF